MTLKERGRESRPQRPLRSMSIGLTLSVAIAGWAAADTWEVHARVDEATGATTESARVVNAGGSRLTVRSAGGRGAFCSLRLPEGADALAGETRLEVRVDDNDPFSIMSWTAMEKPFEGAEDFMEARRRISGVVPLAGLTTDGVDFWCWRALKDQASPASGLLRQVLDGEILTVAFNADESEQTIEFSLDGAADAISSALSITPEPTAMDRAQVELLAFRVSYRGNTCYLLAGKKGRNRCLDAVNRCAQQTHDSVLSMQECIEGK